MKSPVIIYCCTGIEHIIYCIWSVRSLKAYGYEAIEILVNRDWEKKFIESHLKGIQCEVAGVDRAGYGLWAYRPFALEKYKIRHSDRDVVICDTDILWKKDPLFLFRRFEERPWVHKITSLNPKDLDMNIRDVPLSRIGLRTMINYKQRYGLGSYLNFHLNCGLFMLTKKLFPEILKDWVRKIISLPPKEMIMTEALLSLAYADAGLAPSCDRQNIKHLGIHHDPVGGPLVPFQIEELPEGAFTGYQTARHYYGTQRNMLIRDARAMGLDRDGLSAIVKREIMLKAVKRIPTIPKRVLNRFKRAYAKK